MYINVLLFAPVFQKFDVHSIMHVSKNCILEAFGGGLLHAKGILQGAWELPAKGCPKKCAQGTAKEFKKT